MPSPPAAGVPAATVFAFPSGFSGPWEAAAVLTIVIVPALLMVSTIRFRSFKTLDLQSRRSSPVLFLLALFLAALAAQPEIVLLVTGLRLPGVGVHRVGLEPVAAASGSAAGVPPTPRTRARRRRPTQAVGADGGRTRWRLADCR